MSGILEIEHPDAELEAATMKIAERLAAGLALAYRYMKRDLNLALHATMTKTLGAEGALASAHASEARWIQGAPEFGWNMWSSSPLIGVTLNLWDRSCTAGGSSAGAALRQHALHIGSDGGGSVRMPAAYCGIVGLKLTFRRTPFWPPGPFSGVSL